MACKVAALFGALVFYVIFQRDICAMEQENNAILSYPKLNLPEAELSIGRKEGKWYVFDTIRKKNLILTPEEWVRQHIIHYLRKQKEYPKGLFVIERGLQYNKLNKRLDILVKDRSGDPFLLVECKAPSVKLSHATLEQVCMYNQEVGARYLAISNGMKHISLGFSDSENTYAPLKDFPDFI
ncbi:type I restriction enzyme HsdR N-terminal domain-containing protein [Pleomorphovibrio marinus]|uniref:type I restriction enzyme HsdR N-terminal domain-containing protein n=1 Tax=Pleomorphovibrio marinus TaxID=2164132 RepID=UPI001E494D43|nr:type I restriction enzyme HsdR N-terminal domain-containing protein [Pleomorphovibrio marinus]